MDSWVVKSAEAGMKLVDFLSAKLPALTKKKIRQGIDARCCFVNKVPEKISTRMLVEKDRIAWKSFVKAAPVKALKMLYEDDHLLVMDKPPALTVEAEKLRSYFGGKIPLLVHRLDKDTSGALLLAKTPSMQGKLEKLFKQRQVEKLYVALVQGVPEKEEGKINLPLSKPSASGMSKEKMPAVTYWRVWKRFPHHALLICQPITGRTHQIRLHLAAMGCPIVGDGDYGKWSQQLQPLIHRHQLHAWKLSFIHPLSGKKISVTSPLPEDMTQVLRHLEGGDGV